MSEQNVNLTKKERREIKRQEKALEAATEHKRKTVRRMLGWIVAILIIALGIFAIATREADNGANVGELGRLRPDDWRMGNKDALVVLVEYSDFQCPACAQYFPILEELWSENDDIAVVYRHFPLKNIHPNAVAAARAAEAAGRQHKFWAMAKLLFAGQNDWSKLNDPKQVFVRYAETLRMDTARFTADYDSDEIAKAVESDYDEARKSGFSATPTFILNSVKLSSPPQSIAEFEALIENVK